MNYCQITDKPNIHLANALAQFETQFTYPLGVEGRFRISHGEDYMRFYRSLGDAACFVVEQAGEVRGVLAIALRQLFSPGGISFPVAYIGDLKASPVGPRGQTLLELAGAARKWVGGRAKAAFGVVMGGSDKTPESYTGRSGIPAFGRAGEIAILRIPCQVAGERDNFQVSISEAEGIARFADLSHGRYACVDGFPLERSLMRPLWFSDRSGQACGRLEDTRQAKRLFDMQGCELMSAHLSCFAFATINAGCRLIHSALGVAAKRGFSHLFVAVPQPVASSLVSILEVVDIQNAPATVYGAYISTGLWNFNTAEI